MNMPQIPNGPPIEACQVISEVLTVQSKVMTLYHEIKNDINKLVKIIISIKFGIIDIFDLLGEELFAAIGIVASYLAKTLLAAVSGAINSFLESILTKILEILLAFPNAIFSLVAIPLERAQECAHKEQYYMKKARHNIDNVNMLLAKWFNNKLDGSKFYKQMIQSLPFIQKSLRLVQQMESELNSSSDAVFNQSKYDQLRSNLRSAIIITKPSPSLKQNEQFTKSIIFDLDNQRKVLISQVEIKYKNRKKSINEQYTKKIMNLSISHNLVKTIELEQLNFDWADKIKIMESDKKNDLLNIEAKINYQKTISINKLQNFGNDLYQQFTTDMNLVSNYLNDFLSDIKNAYIQNKLCQNFCNTVYNIRSLIINLIKFIISALRNISNSSANIVDTALMSSEAMLSVANDKFEKQIKKYQNNNASSTEMAISVSSGNIILETVDATLSGLITESLIKLINSDDVLYTDNVKFNEFIKRMSAIPDWNSTLNIWAPSPLSSKAVNPYIQLISDITAMVLYMPLLSLSSNIQDQKEISNLYISVNKYFKKITTHNTMVIKVLTSYTPYQSSSCGDLKRILNNAGLLDDFALGLSLSNLLLAINNIVIPNISDMVPTVKNCQKYYPSLFTDTDLIKTSYLENANKMPIIAEVSSIQKSSEKVEESHVEANAIVDTSNFNPHFSDLKIGTPTIIGK